MKGAVQWAPLVVAGVLGLGWLTKYEADKHRSEVFQPPTVPTIRPEAALRPPTVPAPAVRRIQALTSCADLRVAYDDVADRTSRLLADSGRVDQVLRDSMRAAVDRMDRLDCAP